MKRLTIVLAAVVLSLSVLSVVSAQNAETELFAIEIGQVIGYNFNTEEVGAGQSMAIHFGLTDDMELGFVFINGDGVDMPNLQFLRMTYFLSPEYGFQLSTGSDSGMGTPASAVGMFLSPVRRNVNESLITALRLSADFIIPDLTSPAMDEGILAVGITGKIAF